MRYWDSSALLPLMVEEQDSAKRRGALEQDPEILTWWGTSVECVSAVSRLLREGVLDDQAYEQILRDHHDLSLGWVEIQPTEKLRRRAIRLLRVHPLRAADALQLAAALVGSGENPQALPFVCGDPRLSKAAKKEGFTVLD
jgi:predicted nucleic acid-binding protein